MQIISPVILAMAVAAVASAQTSSEQASPPDPSSAPDSTSMSAELAAIAECSTTELDNAQTVLTSNEREQQCETALNLESGTMLQVKTSSATEMCATASCRAALQELYSALPNCRYNLWGLQYSARQLLGYCGITPLSTNSTNNGGDPINWSATSSNALFVPVGADPSTAANRSNAASPVTASSSDSSDATTTVTTILTVLATTAGLVVSFLI